MSVRDAVRDLEHAQKPGWGVPAYTRWLNRRVARYAAAIAQRVGLSPNALSIISFAFSVIGIACLLTLGTTTPWAAGALTAVLLAIGYVLDSADGQLARLLGIPSLAGEWLDHTLDAVRLPTVHMGVLFAALLADEPILPILPILAALFSVAASAHFLSQNLGGLLRDSGGAARPPRGPLRSWLLLPTDSGTLCWLFLLWGDAVMFTAVYAVLLVLNLAHVAAATSRRWQELSTIDEERRGR